MRYDVITIGGALEDIAFFTREGVVIDNKEDILRQKLLAFEFGAKIKVERTYAHFGGGAANAAVSFARLGLKTAIVASIGDDDRGRRILRNFKENGVDTKLVRKVDGKESSYSILIIGPENEHVVFSNRQAGDELLISQKDMTTLNSSKWIYVASLSGKWKSVLATVFSLKCPKIAWNPGYNQLKEGSRALSRFLKKTEVLILNKDEAIELVIGNAGVRAGSENYYNNLDNLLKEIKILGPKTVVITNGENGASIADQERILHISAERASKVADTTGVGDSFGSAFVAGLEIYGNDSRKCIDLAMRNARSVLSQPGAQNGLLTKAEIK